MNHTIDGQSLAIQLSSSLRSSSLSPSFIKKMPALLKVLSRFSFTDLKKHGVSKLFMSITICADQKMRRLNRDYRQKDKTTDVLSFPLFDNLREFDGPWAGPLELGDIIISWPKVLRQAKEFRVTPEQEFVHLVVHGYLHLLGYDHEISRNEELIMEKYEQELVGRIYREFKWNKK